MTKSTDNGIKDASNTGTMAINPPISEAVRDISMLLALQIKEWLFLRSTPGVIFQFINLREPTSGRGVLLIAIGTKDDDVTGNNATLDIEINGVGIDAIVEKVVLEKNKTDMELKNNAKS